MKLSLLPLVLVTACAASPEQKSDAANSAYAADQLSCVQSSITREDADKCRAAKRVMWDAGSEAGK